MTKDETKVLLVEVGQRLCDARMRGYNAEVEIMHAQADLRQATDDWLMAAEELVERGGEEVAELTADEQLDCFLEACAAAGVDPDHEVFADERQTFELMRAQDNAELN
jgi:hypothetical protein